jgi:hypothetical protein
VDAGWDLGGVVLVDEVPEKNEAVICAGGENTAPVGRPFNGIEGR